MNLERKKKRHVRFDQLMKIYVTLCHFFIFLFKKKRGNLKKQCVHTTKSGLFFLFFLLGWGIAAVGAATEDVVITGYTTCKKTQTETNTQTHT